MLTKNITPILMVIGVLQLYGADVSQRDVQSDYPSVRTLNGVVLFEKGDVENVYTMPSAVSMSFYEALRSKTAPIFVSGALLHIVYEYKREYEQEGDSDEEVSIDELKRQAQELANKREEWIKVNQRLEELYEQDEKSSEWEQTIDKVRETSYQLSNEIFELELKLSLAWDLIGQYCVSRIFNFDDWQIYKHPRADAYVLIPRAYENTLDQEWDAKFSQQREKIDQYLQKYDISERELKLGLRVDHADVMQKIETDGQLYRLLQRSWGTMIAKRLAKSWLLGGAVLDKRDLYTPFTSFFVSHEESDPVFGKWNIYLDGHGYPSLKRTSGLDKLLSGVVKPQISGMTYKQFQDFLTFLHTRIQTNFFYWTTCYGGGKNLDVATNMLLHLNGEELVQETAESFLADIPARPFAAASGAVTDAGIPAVSSIQTFLRACLVGETVIPFAKFFDALDRYARIKVRNTQMLAQRGVVGPRQYPQFLQSLLWPHIKEALHAVTPEPRGETDREWVYAAPMVYMPGEKGFEVAEIRDAFLALNKAYLMRTYNSTITAVNKQALLFQESNIPNPLVIRQTPNRYLPLFISLTPGNAMHTIEHLSFSNGIVLPMLLRESFFELDTAYDKLFYIKKLDRVSMLTGELNLPYNAWEYAIEDAMIYIARTPMLRPSAQRKHSVVFTLTHEQDQPRYVKVTYKSEDLVYKEISEQKAKKEKEAMVTRITNNQQS